jgi:hypothetical protein
MARRSSPGLLPTPFAVLEKWVPDWVLADSSARLEKRLTTPLPEIRAFYHGMLEQAEAALAFLAKRQLGELDAAEERLLKLMLSLAEIGTSIEWYGTGAYADAFDPRRFPLVVTLPDNQAQGAAA